jgi:hypothetical protein
LKKHICLPQFECEPYTIRRHNGTLRPVYFHQQYTAMTDINFSYSLGALPSDTAELEALWSFHGIQIIPATARRRGAVQS